MQFLDEYNICPICGDTLISLACRHPEPVTVDGEDYLGTEGACACGWRGMVLWENPPYIATANYEEIEWRH